MSEKGYVHVYTGNGKGKTTAAFGLALRAAGAGLRVYIAQFVKGMVYSELEAFARFDDLVTVEQYGRGCFIRNQPTADDVNAAQKGLEQVRDVIASCAQDLVILDEANIAVLFGLFGVEDLLDLIDHKPQSLELVITGRHADPRVIERADLVTEMREIKHYYAKGVQARPGIES
jgi:cob(I)alamin adenosyltransferase